MRQKSSMPSSMARVKNGPIALDARAGGLELLGRRLDRGGDLGVDRQADAGVEHQADAQAATSRSSRASRSSARGRLIVSRSSGCASTPISSAASATLRVIGPATRPAYGGSIGIRPRLGFRVKMPHQAGRQAHRAADVGADVQRPVAGGDRRARAGAAAARALAQVPGVARQARGSSTGPTTASRSRASSSCRGSPRPPRASAPPAARRCCAGTSTARRGAQRHRRAAGGDVLLDHRRHAVERADVLAGATWRSQRASEARAAASAARGRARRSLAGAAPRRRCASSTARVTSTGESERSR